MNNITESIVTVLVGITGVALLAVIVSQKSDTSKVIGALFGGYAQALSAAVSPITGNVVGTASLTSGGGAYLNQQNFMTS